MASSVSPCPSRRRPSPEANREPNDAIAVPKDFDAALADRIQKTLVGISEAQAKTILPNHYTGFVAATHENYRMIEEAGILVGRLKKK